MPMPCRHLGGDSMPLDAPAPLVADDCGELSTKGVVCVLSVCVCMGSVCVCVCVVCGKRESIDK